MSESTSDAPRQRPVSPKCMRPWCGANDNGRRRYCVDCAPLQPTSAKRDAKREAVLQTYREHGRAAFGHITSSEGAVIDYERNSNFDLVPVEHPTTEETTMTDTAYTRADETRQVTVTVYADYGIYQDAEGDIFIYASGTTPPTDEQVVWLGIWAPNAGREFGSASGRSWPFATPVRPLRQIGVAPKWEPENATRY